MPGRRDQLLRALLAALTVVCLILTVRSVSLLGQSMDRVSLTQERADWSLFQLYAEALRLKRAVDVAALSAEPLDPFDIRLPMDLYLSRLDTLRGDDFRRLSHESGHFEAVVEQSITLDQAISALATGDSVAPLTRDVATLVRTVRRFMQDAKFAAGAHTDKLRAEMKEALWFTLITEGSVAFLLLVFVILATLRTREAEKARDAMARALEEAREMRRIAEAARERAEKADEAKGRFLAVTSHELRTPLHGITGALQVVGEGLTGERKKHFHGIASDCASVLLKNVEDILDFSALEAGRLQLDPSPCDPAGLVREVVRLFTVQAAAKGLRLDASVDDDCPKEALVDAHRVRQILINLVGNAVKFTAKGAIGVEIKRCQCPPGSDARMMEVAVWDQGPGIPADQLSTIFEPFQRGDSARTRRKGGTGLGLAISRKLARQMGGDVTVESLEDVGSRFTFTLPFDVVTVENDTAPCAPAAAKQGPLRVLVAEDNGVNAQLMRVFLERLGHTAVLVEDGEQAVSQALSVAFDVVLMDVEMPVMDGLEAARRIIDTLGDSAPPLVAVTANVSQRDRDVARAAGMSHFLGKPFRLEALEAVLAAALADPTDVDLAPRPLLAVSRDRGAVLQVVE